MTSARRLYRVVVAFALAGAAAAVAGVAVAAARTTFALPSGAALAAACGRLLPSGTALLSFPLFVLAAIGILATARGGASLASQARAMRRFRSALRPCGRVEIAAGPVTVLDDPQPHAFCAGHLRPRIYVSVGALERLSGDELEAVVAHERHHLRRRDPLRLLIVRVLADALFFLPAVRHLGDRYVTLAEVAADEAATRAAGASTLASALLAFNPSASQELVVGIAPERVDHLLGATAGWELPASLFLGAVVTLGGLAATIVAVVRSAGAHVGVAMVLAQSCMATMLAAAVAAAGAAALVARRRRA